MKDKDMKIKLECILTKNIGYEVTPNHDAKLGDLTEDFFGLEDAVDELFEFIKELEKIKNHDNS